MNELEARIIMICKETRQVKEVCKKLWERHFEREYSHICKTCSLLSDKGLLVKRDMGQGSTRGRPSYYTATDRGIAEAVRWIDNLIKERQKAVATTNITKLGLFINKQVE